MAQAAWAQDLLIEIEADGCGDADCGEEGVCAAVVSRVDAPPILEPAEHDLNFMALPVEPAVMCEVCLAVGFCRDASLDIPLGESLAVAKSLIARRSRTAAVPSKCEISYADKGYDSNALRRQTEERGAMPNIPPKANCIWWL